MSIVPQTHRAPGMPMAVRNVLFWFLMVLLAVVLWQMTSRSGRQSNGASLSYSDFLNQVNAGNVETANVAIAQNTADITGELKTLPHDYQTTVPRDTLTPLLDSMRSKGASVQVSEARESTGKNFVLGIAPIVVLIGFWIYMMRMQMRNREKRNPSGTPPGALG